MSSLTNDLKQYFNSMNYKLSWKNLSLWIKKKNNKFWTILKQEEYVKILNNVSGVLYSGTLTAIIGTSGSGKTTLLTAVSQRSNGVVTGDILLNNSPVSRETMKSISGFLPQQDFYSGYLTVMEHMQFMARLKMDQNTTSQRRNQNIFMILTRLGLGDKSDTRICFLSGGESKKLSLAEQLITDPPFLFCDEPTTGLDSYNAENVIKILHDITSFGKAVICTIHQPTYGVFEIFDEVVFLVRGSIIFHGPVDKFSEFFTTLGVEYPIGYNPVDYYMTWFAERQFDALYLQNICDEFERSKFAKNLRKELNYHIISNGGLSQKNNNLPKSKHKLKFCKQFYWLLWRHYVNIKRDKTNNILQFILYMFIALLLSTMYWKIASEFDQKDVQNMEGLIFLIITETIFTFSYSILHSFPEELPKLLRDMSDGCFDPGPYYLSKIVSMIPLMVIETLCYSSLIFWSTGLPGGFFSFIYFYLPNLFSAFSSTAYGFVLSTSFESVATASLVSVPIEFLGMSYSGIYINIKNLCYLTFWLPYISQFYYGTEAISIKQWAQIDTLECERPDLPCLETGKMVLDKYGFHENRYFIDLLALFIFCFICHLIGFYSFKKKCKREASY